MEIFVRIKMPGKRKDILTPTPYTIPDGMGSLRQLLIAVTEQEVKYYNEAVSYVVDSNIWDSCALDSKFSSVQLMSYLTQQELDNQIYSGKVRMGTIYSEKKAEPQKAIDTVLQCWEDGIIRVFMNDEELQNLDLPIQIHEGAVFTFMRLTFLAGSIW